MNITGTSFRKVVNECDSIPAPNIRAKAREELTLKSARKWDSSNNPQDFAAKGPADVHNRMKISQTGSYSSYHFRPIDAVGSCRSAEARDSLAEKRARTWSTRYGVPVELFCSEQIEQPGNLQPLHLIDMVNSP